MLPLLSVCVVLYITTVEACTIDSECGLGICKGSDCHCDLDEGQFLQNGICVVQDCISPDHTICSGAGQCVRLGSSAYGCQCDPPYRLMFSNMCVKESCITTDANGAETVCNERGMCDDNGECHCVIGFIGEHCTEDQCGSVIDTRYPTIPGHIPSLIACNGGGHCSMRHEAGRAIKYACSCFTGFSGPECSEFQCTNNGDCSDNGLCYIENPATGESHCKCYDGYDGKDCGINNCNLHTEEIMSDHFMCNGGGKCVFNETNPGIIKHYCSCRHGWSGEHCDVFSCKNNHANCNGGSCIHNSATGEYVCEACPLHMHGLDCGINSCDIRPDGTMCNGRGSCEDWGSHSICNCTTGWAGKACEKQDCRLAGCSGHGTCAETASHAVCFCDDGYAGLFCEHCAPGLEVFPYLNADGSSSTVCAHPNCVFKNAVCSNIGHCVYNSSALTYECACGEEFEVLHGACWHSNCIHDAGNGIKAYCGVGGSCIALGSGSYGCKCAAGSWLHSGTGVCWSTTCLTSGNRLCSGHGSCQMSALDRDYKCVCSGSYVLNKNGECVLHGGLVAVAVVVPLIIVLGVALFCVYWFILRKRNMLSSHVRMKDTDIHMTSARPM